MMEESAVGDFADRLRYEFEDRTSGASENGESQDWFVNDKRDDSRTPSPTKSDVTARDGERKLSNSGQTAAASSVASGTAPALGPQVLTTKASKLTMAMKKPNAGDDATDQNTDECGTSMGKTAFLHHIPHTCGVLVMELGIGDQVMERRYGSKFFRIYLPQVHESQSDYCLYARKRLNKHKYRFSLNEHSMSKWTNEAYSGKVLLTPTPQAKRFKLVVPKAAARVSFDIAQETRKQELVVKLNAQPKRFNLFRGRAGADEHSDVFKALIQKFINPVVEVRCPKTSNTVFKIEKEGEVGAEKYIVTYMRPFSLFVSCCIAVGVEAHLLD